MLRKKTSGVARGPLSSSFIGKAAETVVDRRAFLRGSGLAIGGLATAAALVGSNVTPAQAVGQEQQLKLKSQFVRIVRSVVPSLLKCKMAFGLGKSLVGIAQSILVRIVQKVLLCGKPQAVSVA